MNNALEISRSLRRNNAQSIIEATNDKEKETEPETSQVQSKLKNDIDEENEIESTSNDSKKANRPQLLQTGTFTAKNPTKTSAEPEKSKLPPPVVARNSLSSSKKSDSQVVEDLSDVMSDIDDDSHK